MKLIRVGCEQCRGNGEVLLDGFIESPCAYCRGEGSYVMGVDDNWEPEDLNDDYYLEEWINDN